MTIQVTVTTFHLQVENHFKPDINLEVESLKFCDHLKLGPVKVCKFL